MSEPAPLAVAECSITTTQRGRFFWAVWWSGPPEERPFRKPDASNGGAASHEAAWQAAEDAAGRGLIAIEPRWAKAWIRVLRGRAAFEPSSAGKAAKKRAEKPASDEQRTSAWSLLGLAPGASAEEVKRAYRLRVLETHPDRGGDEAVFRAVQRAYERLLIKVRAPARKKRP